MLYILYITSKMGISNRYMQMKYENMYIFIANHSTKVLLLKSLLYELFFLCLKLFIFIES